jgi:ethanolamine permease
MGEKPPSLVRYENVDGSYLEKRTLKKSAGWVLLWALGVGAVISGEFYGWHFGLPRGGFWGLAFATGVVAALYVCLVFSIAELSAALPHAGGFYSFTRSAFGPLGGFICGVTDAIEYVLTPAVIAVGISTYLAGLLPEVYPWAWWIAVYALFVAVNVIGVEVTLKLGLVITLLAIGVLAAFFIAVLATGSFQWELLFNIPADPGQSERWLPKGWWGVLAAMPSAIWFFLAIEQLPLAAEESHNAVRDLPRALIFGILTLLVFALLTLVLNTGVGGGAAAIGKAELAPLLSGFEAVFGKGPIRTVCALAALTGLVASFHGTVYAYGRVLFALSRAGYVPRWLSITGARKTPVPALLTGAAVGLACAALIEFWPKGEGGAASAVGAALLNMAVFGAVISYALVMASFIVLRLRRPELQRPYRSPLGIPGAALGGALSIVALVSTFLDAEMRPGVIGLAVLVVAALGFFFFHSRKHLVAQAPEEAVALRGESGG